MFFIQKITILSKSRPCLGGNGRFFCAGQIIMYLMSSSKKTHIYSNLFINFLNSNCMAEASGIKLVQSWWELCCEFTRFAVIMQIPPFNKQ